MTFRQAVVQSANQTHTENGMPALKSSLNANVDLFFCIGASRGKDITTQFNAALAEDPEMAVRNLLWARDARGGQGERQTFRTLLKRLESTHQDALLERIVPLVPELGRWDDLLIFDTKQWQEKAYAFIFQALASGDNLCAKWMPRKGPIAVAMTKYFGITPKQYRKGLVALSNTVEQLMCARKWDEIEFGKLPSVASARYQKAFGKRCKDRYDAYKSALVKGTAKVNASTLYPYDVLKSAMHGDQVVAQAQWDALPNFLQDGTAIVPVVDVSGSMQCAVGDGKGVLQCIDVAVSLGMYIADKQQGPFNGVFVSFTDRAEVGTLTKGHSLLDKRRAIMSRVGYSTNIQAVFKSVLDVARRGKVAQADMPKYILIFSDMQFDGGQVSGRDVGSFQMARKMFSDAGYELPKLIYWNLHARGDNTPVKFDQQGVALVSGFSPSLVKSILGAKNVTPADIMRETLMNSRYDH